jgi:hypothetical protein
MLDDMTFEGIKHRLETSLIALDDDITPDQFTELSIALDTLQAKLVEAVRKEEPSEDDINGMVLLAEQEFNDSVGEQKELVREMAAGEEIEPLADMFQLSEGMKPGDEVTVTTAGDGNGTSIYGLPVDGKPMSLDDKIKASIAAKKDDGTV